MKVLSVSAVAEASGGEVIAGSSEVSCRRVSTDTRRLADGDLFIALRGDRFDANGFAADALRGGASVVMVERWEGAVPEGKAVILVKDGLLGLQRLAWWYRRCFSIPVVGITGSNGKTSTKDFTRSVLAQGYRVRATAGNLNNHIGLPLTVLSMEDGDTVAVMEMGMNHAGEIAPLCEIAAPKVGIITNIGTAHIEHLGTREAIAEEKGTLGRALPEDGVLLVPAGCDFFDYFKKRTRAKVIPVGNGRGWLRAENLRVLEDRSAFDLVIDGERVGEVELPVAGRHMVTNALLAAGAGWHLGLKGDQIIEGLRTADLTSGRLRRYVSAGVVVLDDTYNANPEAMAAAIETLAELPVAEGGRRWAVLGRMGELGPLAVEAHPRVGRLAAERGLRVLAAGEGAEGIAAGAGCDWIEVYEDAAERLRSEVRPGDVVLFKASRSAAMERLMQLAFPP